MVRKTTFMGYRGCFVGKLLDLQAQGSGSNSQNPYKNVRQGGMYFQSQHGVETGRYLEFAGQSHTHTHTHTIHTPLKVPVNVFSQVHKPSISAL